jgi:plasmid stabilization system protein ParE
VIKARFLPDAEAELLAEVSYYSNAGTGLGIKFARAVEVAVGMAIAHPERGRPAARGTRTRLVKGFPFSIVYRPTQTEILVVAIMHHRKKPGYWLARI